MAHIAAEFRVYNAHAMMKVTGIFVSAFVGFSLAAAGRARAAENRLDALYAVDWRGLPLRQALDKLAQDTRTPYRTDDIVPPEVVDRRIRLFASHLTGRQAFRWAARLAGLEAVIRDNLVLVAPPSRLPRTWRLTGGAGAEPPGWPERMQALAVQRASVTWVDAPLSSVARDISCKFGIDAIFHPDLVSAEPLVHLELSEGSLDLIRSALQDQLNVRTDVIDGALWVAPASVETDGPATRPANWPGAAATASSAGAQPALPVGPLEQSIILDLSVQNWQDLCGRLSQASGLACRVNSQASPFPGPLQARGGVGEVLESARLSGRLIWRLVPGRGSTPPTLELRPGPAKR